MLGKPGTTEKLLIALCVGIEAQGEYNLHCVLQAAWSLSTETKTQ